MHGFRVKWGHLSNVFDACIVYRIKEPAERVLGRHHEQINGKMKEVCDSCYDIPLFDSLQCLLQTDIVREQVYIDNKNLYICNGCYCTGNELTQSVR